MITVRGGLKNALRWLVRRTGFDLVKFSDGGLPPDFDDFHRSVVGRVRAHTMTSPERLFGLVEGVRYVLRRDLPGAFVECGVYKGGSMMAVALTLLDAGVTDRELFLYDTFEGMPRPGEHDLDLHGNDTAQHFERTKIDEQSSEWLSCSLERVREAVLSTGYPERRVHTVKGVVEETLPAGAPDEIALLRLDTDWYASTRHELEHLYPRLVDGGVMIIDDYGHFQGARKAVDEYFKEQGLAMLLGRLDYTGRMCVKSPSA